MKRRKTTPPALTLSQPDVERLAEHVRALRASKLETLSEAAVFCAAAQTADELTVVGIGAKVGMPISTVSRVVYALEQRGLLRYEQHPKDRRKKIVRANLRAAA